MVATKSTEEVLQEIERDLRADERIWKRVDRDLATLGGHPRRRTDLIVAGVIGIVVLLAGAFALGWNMAPSSSGTAATVAATTPIRFNTSGLAEKRLALTTRYGTSEAAMDPSLWPPMGGGTGSPFTATAVAEKQRAFQALHGGSESAPAPVMESPPMTRAGSDAWRDYIRTRYGTGVT